MFEGEIITNAAERATIDTPKWYPMKAYKAELRTETALMNYPDVETFIPKHLITTKRHGKEIRMPMPVIPTLVFVHASLRQLFLIKKDLSYLQYVWMPNRSDQSVTRLVIPDDQMESFILVASKMDEGKVTFHNDYLPLEQGTPIRVTDGVFKGAKGIYLRPKGKRSRHLVVQIDGVGSLVVEVAPSMVESLSQQ